MLQHQLVQSPARLGLSNPTSPSLQNPTPPKLPPHHPSNLSSSSSSSSSTITTTSSTLLSLLPPLPRAQSLLLQMASLASKLFELSPNRSLWLSSFRGSLPTFLSSHPHSQPPPLPDPSPSSTKEILSLFTSLQTQLFEAVAQLQEILDLQDAKQKIAREIRSKDAEILAFANKVKDAERVLDILVDDYSDYRRPKRAKLEKNGVEDDDDDDGDDGDDDDDDKPGLTTVASRLKLDDILSYAHRISYTTFAPPEFGAGQAPLRGALPPAPQDEQMRASQLYNFANLDVGLPKAVESNERSIEAMIEPPPQQPLVPSEPNPLSNLAAIQGLLPNITVPSGWKPGMPVELPTDLPVPPPGWKPGDPVPLPALDSLPVPRVEEQQLRPLQGLNKPLEPIQVRPVQLDILDQDDDSSDYSSDDASSEDDD